MSGMSCGTHCRETWKAPLRRPNRPPKGGWAINQIPLLIQQQAALQFAWESRKPRAVSSAHEAVEEMISFLRVNAVTVTTQIREQIQNEAALQYCAAEPTRCSMIKSAAPGHQPVKASQAARAQMMWAGGFWITANILAAGTFPNPGATFDRMAWYALDLLSTPAGCEHCHGHWTRVLEYAPPLERITSMAHARVWLWRAHNASREERAPTPFKKVAQAWKWPELSDAQVDELLTQMGMVHMP